MAPSDHFTLKKGKTKSFPILVILIIALAGVGAILLMSSVGKTYLDSLSSSLSFRSQKVAIILASAKSDYKVGETAEVNIIANPYKKSYKSAHVILSYDPSLLRADVVDSKMADKSSRYLNTQDSVFKNFAGVSIDNQKGRISFTADIDPQDVNKGTGKIAGLDFKVLKKGDAKVEVVTSKDAKTSSSIIAINDMNILEIVKNLDLKLSDK